MTGHGCVVMLGIMVVVDPRFRDSKSVIGKGGWNEKTKGRKGCESG